MAAPSQSSPNQASQSTDTKSADNVSVPTSDMKDKEVAEANAFEEPQAAAAAESPTAVDDDEAPARPQEDLTYAGTEASDAYLSAKQLMKDGEFDAALETIATAMTTVTSLLPEDYAPDLHESMAPLYYLYGTTLLYSVEESADALPTANVATNTTASGSDSGEAGAGISSFVDAGAQGAEAGGDDDEEEADDSQIAWENLESARHIVTKLLQKQADPTIKEKLQLDLAQIHLRLGDMQRFNGRSREAVHDYQQCLELRQSILPKYDRKVAVLHHLLGLVYALMASEGDKQLEEQKEAPTQGDEATLTPQQVEEYRSNSIQHYVACGKAFAGQIAVLCGEDPEAITAEASEQEEGVGKTTGMDVDELALCASSRTIQVIRARVAKLESSTDSEDIHEFKELLDDIQETIDEVESTKKVFKGMSKIKAQISAEAAASAGAHETTNADGSTSSIGFGAPQLYATATASASAAAPVMMVRKKKKPDNDAPPPDNVKRTKTE